MALRNGFSWASGTAWIAIIGIGAFLTWSAVNKPQAVENYAKGSSSYTSTLSPVNNAYPLGCSRFEMRPDGTYVDMNRKGKNGVTTNSSRP